MFAPSRHRLVVLRPERHDSKLGLTDSVAVVRAEFESKCVPRRWVRAEPTALRWRFSHHTPFSARGWPAKHLAAGLRISRPWCWAVPRGVTAAVCLHCIHVRAHCAQMAETLVLMAGCTALRSGHGGPETFELGQVPTSDNRIAVLLRVVRLSNKR